MSWQSCPTESGMYHVKLAHGRENEYWKHTVDGAVHYVQLGSMEDPDNRLKWRFDRVSGDQARFTIRPASDLWFGLVPPTDKGYGYIEGRRGRAANWMIQNEGGYSKIFQDASDLVLDYRDEGEGSRVHLWPNENGPEASGQRWIFRLAQGPGMFGGPVENVDPPVRQEPVVDEDRIAVDRLVNDLEDSVVLSEETEQWDPSHSTEVGSQGRSPIWEGTASGNRTPTENSWDEPDAGSFRRSPMWEGSISGGPATPAERSEEYIGRTYSATSVRDESIHSGSNSTFLPDLSDSKVKDNPPSFENLWFTLTPEEAAKEAYDIIIIGSGMGAGVVAGDLYDTNTKLGSAAKSVLVIEKGGIPFHSHSLNGPGSSSICRDPEEQTDMFFSLFKNNYRYEYSSQPEQWKGGSMINLGGRSAVWNLHAPRIHDEVLRSEFGQLLYTELVRVWYKEAEQLMGVSLPSTNSLQQGIMDRLNMECGHGSQWQWGRIASESDNGSIRHPYTPVDKLFDAALSKRRDPVTLEPIEHQNWKLLVNTSVHSIEWAGSRDERATGVHVRDSRGLQTTIQLKRGGNIVLGAGSVESPAILMRSGLTRFLEDNGGLHLTDHDILTRTVSVQFLDSSLREKARAIRLQSYVKLRSGKIVLACIAIDSQAFGPRHNGGTPHSTTGVHSKLTTTYILPASLNKRNMVRLNYQDEPVVDGDREQSFNPFDFDVAELRDFDKVITMVLKEMLQLEFRMDDPHGSEDERYFKILQLGSFGHELGTIPLQRHVASDSRRVPDPYCLESSLQLRGHDNVYVCDLSIFPSSPGAHPALTLIALALRLSRSLLPRNASLDVSSLSYQEQLDWSKSVVVVNQTGKPIKVFVSNVAGVPLAEAEMRDRGSSILGPGERIARPRRLGTNEVVLVYSLDSDSGERFVERPVPHVAAPGDRTPCIVY